MDNRRLEFSPSDDRIAIRSSGGYVHTDTLDM